MRILTRYVLREFCVPLVYCMIGFLSIYVLFELFESFSRLLDAKPPISVVLAFFAGYVSPYLEWLVPAALLLASLYTMWSFCRHSEIIAMRASGIGFLSIVKPMLGVAIVMACAVLYVNECYVPHAADWANRLRSAKFVLSEVQRDENVLLKNQASHRTWRVGKMRTSDGYALEDVRLSIFREDGRSRLCDITAQKVDYLDGVWWFTYPTYQYFDAFGTPVASPTPDLAKLTFRAFPELTEMPRDFLLQNKSWDYYSTLDMVHYLQNHPNLKSEDRTSRIYDIHARLAAPFACIIITLFAIPAGVATGRQSVFKGVMFAVGMFFAFYAMTIAGMVIAKNGWCPPLLAAWSANATFFVIGLYFFHRQR